MQFMLLRRKLAASLCIPVGLGFISCAAQGQTETDWIQLNWENDFFAGEDNGYTNGTGVSWGRRGLEQFDGQSLPGWLGFLAEKTYLANFSGRQRAVSYTLGQAMYTPTDIEQTQLIENDRPYAGLLVWGASLYAFDEEVSDRLSLMLGVVGPAAGAKHTQKLIHDVVGSDTPQGWGNQLDNEPVFSVEAQRLWRVEQWRRGGLEFDIIAGAGGGAGNLLSQVSSGVALRVGSQLGGTWSAVSLIPSRTINTFASESIASWQLYFSLGGRYVLNDITIDGNTFSSSHSVPLEHTQGIMSAGLAVNRGQWGASFSYQLGTDQFEGQRMNTRFGALALTYLF
ncbi:hypothetical protein LCGC14_0300700 [marine sediment metagenome]